MEQRPLRLGDIVDDYCPRERRITNHAIVAIVDQSIRQTRCTTCDAEHAYKDAKVPRRKKKEDGDALYEEVLADLTGAQLVPKNSRDTEPAAVHASKENNGHGEANGSAPDTSVAESPAAAAEDTAAADQGRADDHWPAHRTLIRATLPRVEGGEPPPRPIPEFTMHQRQGRGGHGFRYGQQGWSGNGTGNGQGRNGFRPGRGGHGQGQGQPGGGGGRHRHRGGKNRQPK